MTAGDGRGIDDSSPVAEVGILPRTHGSGLFTRQTQVLTVANLGSP